MILELFIVSNVNHFVVSPFWLGSFRGLCVEILQPEWIVDEEIGGRGKVVAFLNLNDQFPFRSSLFLRVRRKGFVHDVGHLLVDWITHTHVEMDCADDLL